MDADEVMKLFDSYWFELGIFGKEPKFESLSSLDQNQGRKIESLSRSDQNPSYKIESLSSLSDKIKSLSSLDQNPGVEIEEEARITKLPSLHTRSMSDQLSSFNSGLLSPDSVLLGTPKLHTIFSGKDFAGDENDDVAMHKELADHGTTKGKGIKRRRRHGGENKSLSDLEFEELKGFMDLGFVFSEEDKDSSLASIIPGLQRLGKKDVNEQEKQSVSVPRPYLSEAWEVLEENPLMNWRVPSLRNEMALKDNLKWWAHAVASTVR